MLGTNFTESVIGTSSAILAAPSLFILCDTREPPNLQVIYFLLCHAMHAPSHAPCRKQVPSLDSPMIATFLRNQEEGYGRAPHCNMKIISRTEAGVQMNYKVTKGLKKTQRQKAAAKRKSAIIGSDVYSLQACDGRDDDKDELELIEDGSYIENASFTEDDSDGSSVATNDSVLGYAVNRFTKTCQEFTKAIETFEESANETADVILAAATWKFPKEHRDSYDEFVDRIKATSCATATNVTEATDVTECIIYPVVTEASVCTEISVVTDASVYVGLTGPTRERSEKYPAVEVSYNSQAVRTLGTQVQKKKGAFSTPLLSSTRDTDDVSLFTSVPERMAQF